MNLFDALAADDATEIRRLIAAGADLDERDGLGRSAVCVAAMHDRVEALAALLVGGADPNLGSLDGLTPLMHAARGNHFRATELLLCNRADPMRRDAQGWTALDHSKVREVSIAGLRGFHVTLFLPRLLSGTSRLLKNAMKLRQA